MQQEHLSLVFFVYGLALFAMGLAIVLEVRPNSKLPLARNLWPLAGFGLLHAGVEWSEMVAISLPQQCSALELCSLPLTREVLLAASTLSLAWFGAALLVEEGGRWRLFRWIPPVLFLVYGILVLWDLAQSWEADRQWARWSSAWARYLLYLPGSAMSALALARQAPALRSLGMSHVATDCRLAAGAFAFNAVVAGLVVPRGDFFPANVLNYQSFVTIVGVPPVFFRAFSAVAVAFFVVRVLRLFDAQSRLEREHFASQALMAQEEERKRVARGLHDDTAQLLSSLLVRLSLLDQAASMSDVRRHRDELMALAARAVEGVRRLALELRPPELDDLGLAEAMRWYMDDLSTRLGIRVYFGPSAPTDRLAPTTELVLYRIVQEAMTNVARHAGAKHVQVSLEFRDSTVVLSVEDDGRGFDVAAVLGSKERGMGLMGMQERVSLLGGRLRIQSSPGAGTRVAAEVPRTAAGG